MATWLNHVAIAMPRNGTTSNTVDPASSGTVVAGTRFTPTAGRLLLLVVEGPVTSTTPSGWTLPTNGSAINNTGLYVWHRTAAGSDTITTTHGSSNFPVAFHWFEFTSGSTFVASASAINVATNGTAGPTLSGLTGTNLIFGALGLEYAATSGSASVDWSVGVTSVTTTVINDGVTNGYVYSLTYLEDSALSSAQPIATSGGSNAERLVFAVNVAANPDGTVTAVRAQGTGQASAPTVSSSADGTVVAVRAQGTGLAQAPGVSGESVISGGGPATGTGQAHAPVVTGDGGSGATIVAVRATGTGSARAPGVNVVETLPANIGLGRVTGRFGSAQVLVSDPDGVADFYPITDATITFTSTAKVLVNETASPAPVVILPKPIVCTLDSQGYLVDSAGNRWCDLIRTDDVDVKPSTRKWRVEFSGELSDITTFEMTVTTSTASPVDLTTLIPT